MVSVPAGGGTEKEIRDYATALDEAIQQVRGRVCGWVVDLRPSSAGGVGVGAAFVGLSSLLPDGPVITFVDRDGVAGSGYSLAGSTLTVAPSAIVPDIEVPSPPFPRVPLSPKITQPVVVLQSSLTASTGEATVVAFKGRPQTRFVGQPTFGASSSGNMTLVGPFGSSAVLTAGLFQDRAGVTYPEEPIPTNRYSPGRRTTRRQSMAPDPTMRERPINRVSGVHLVGSSRRPACRRRG